MTVTLDLRKPDVAAVASIIRSHAASAEANRRMAPQVMTALADAAAGWVVSSCVFISTAAHRVHDQTLRQNVLASWSRYESLGKIILRRRATGPSTSSDQL